MSAPDVLSLPGLREALNDPTDGPVLRMYVADDLITAEDPRGQVLARATDVRRRVTSLALPTAFDAFYTHSPGWEAAARRLEALAAHPEDTEQFREQCQRLLRGDVSLDPEDLEATLRLQYDLQVRLLRSLNLLEGQSGQHFITAVDGKQYPLPTFEDVLARLEMPAIRTKLTQGFDTLLLVPFGLSLDRLCGAWREGMRRNEAALRSVGQFNRDDPLWIWDEYRTESLVYDPHAFATRHGGRPKEQVLREERRGFDVLLVEGAIPDLPRTGEGRRVGGRGQPTCGRTPAEYLRDLSDDEVGLTPEAYVVHFLDGLERRGHVVDYQTASYLLGAYFPSSRRVPVADWGPEGGRARLNGGDPVYRYDGDGVRAAVRVR